MSHLQEAIPLQGVIHGVKVPERVEDTESGIKIQQYMCT